MNNDTNNASKVEFKLAAESSDCGCDSGTSTQSSSCCGPDSSTQAANDSSCCGSDAPVQTEGGSSCCGSDAPAQETASSSCGCSGEKKEEVIEQVDVDYNITIDGKSVHVEDASKNIVEIAKAAGIAIPAPCFLAKKKKGCCMSCVIEIDAEQEYACNTRPKEGMNVIVDREDLKALRKERLLKYQAASKNGNKLKCGEV